MLAWLGGSVLGIANGVIRETVYKDRVGDLTADQISAATLVALLALSFWVVERPWPITHDPKGSRNRYRLGGADRSLRVRIRPLSRQKSRSELFENYNLAGGNLWLLVLAWVGIGPAAMRAVRHR